MGANPTQALALLVFLVGSILLAAGLRVGGSIPLIIVGIVVTAASIPIFLMAKRIQTAEE
jgi:hypothetical protein